MLSLCDSILCTVHEVLGFRAAKSCFLRPLPQLRSATQFSSESRLSFRGKHRATVARRWARRWSNRWHAHDFISDLHVQWAIAVLAAPSYKVEEHRLVHRRLDGGTFVDLVRGTPDSKSSTLTHPWPQERTLCRESTTCNIRKQKLLRIASRSRRCLRI